MKTFQNAHVYLIDIFVSTDHIFDFFKISKHKMYILILFVFKITYWQIIKKKFTEDLFLKKMKSQSYIEHQAPTGNDRGVHIITGADRGCESGVTEDYKVYNGCIQGVTGDQIYYNWTYLPVMRMKESFCPPILQLLPPVSSREILTIQVVPL